MKKITFTAEDLPVSECTFGDGKMTMRFKNGKDYVFDKESYLRCVRRQFEYISNGKIPLQGIEKSIQDALEARDAEDRDESLGESKGGGEDGPRERKIAFRLFEKEDMQEDRDFADLSKFDELCENIMSIEGELLEDFQYMLMEQLERLVFSQDFLLLTRKDRSDWVKAKIQDKTYKYMYFYTNGRVENGYEIWYKAYDPMLWAGVSAHKAEKR